MISRVPDRNENDDDDGCDDDVGDGGGGGNRCNEIKSERKTHTHNSPQ